MSEIWKDVVGYEGFYEVSNLGNVRGVNRVHFRRDTSGREYPVHVPSRLLRKKDNTNGYYRVTLSKDNHTKQVFVHRLVAEAFVQKTPDCDYVDHINADRHDNRASNLQWISQGDNIHYSYVRGNRVPIFQLHPDFIEKANVAAKKPVIRDDGVVFQSVTEAAKAMGVSHGCVCHCLKGRCKTVKGHSFKYKD